jgi:hypothetical protein
VSLAEDIVDQRHQEYRDLFRGVAKGSMGSLQVVKNKLRRFLSSEDASFDELLEAAKIWVKEKGSPYAGHADNFLYLKKKDGEISRAKQMIKQLRSQDKIESWINDII